MNSKKSIFKDLYEKRKSLAVKIGLTGVIILLSSLLIKKLVPVEQPADILYILDILIDLMGKVGEAFILSGFVVYVLEEHPLTMMVKDLSRSIIDEIIDKYFHEKELLDFIFRGIKNLNKYERIDDEIYSLYEKHGLLELTDEPRRTNISIIFKNEGYVENESGKILLNRMYDYRAINDARPGGNSKLINRDGLVAFYDVSITTGIDETKDGILKCIHNYLDISFKFSTSFEIKDSLCNKNLLPLEPDFISEKDFDIKNCRPNNDSGFYVFKKEFEPKLYAVYDIFQQSDGNKLLKLNLYLNVRIPPGEYIDIDFEIKGIVPDYDLWTYEFISYSKGVTFELQMGEEFETRIEEVIIGVQNTPIKSNSKLKYNGWIMPHSSISAAWKRKT